MSSGPCLPPSSCFSPQWHVRSIVCWLARARDRVLAADALYLNSLLLLLTFGIRTGSVIYFEVALIIALLGFVSTVALSKFLMRGEVIE